MRKCLRQETARNLKESQFKQQAPKGDERNTQRESTPCQTQLIPAGFSQFKLVPAGSKQFQVVPEVPDSSRWFQLVPDGSSWFQTVPREPPVGTVEPLSEAGGASGNIITDKKLHKKL